MFQGQFFLFRHVCLGMVKLRHSQGLSQLNALAPNRQWNLHSPCLLYVFGGVGHVWELVVGCACLGPICFGRWSGYCLLGGRTGLLVLLAVSSSLIRAFRRKISLDRSLIIFNKTMSCCVSDLW